MADRIINEFEILTIIELCEMWGDYMRTAKTCKEMLEDLRFAGICKELDNRKVGTQLVCYLAERSVK